MSDHTKQLNRPAPGFAPDEEEPSDLAQTLPLGASTLRVSPATTLASRTTLTRGAMRLEDVEAPAPPQAKLTPETTIIGLKRNFAGVQAEALAQTLIQAPPAKLMATHGALTAPEPPSMPQDSPQDSPEHDPAHALQQTLLQRPGHARRVAPSHDEALAQTLQGAPEVASPAPRSLTSPEPSPGRATIRTTSLPRVELTQDQVPALRHEDRERYHKVKALGQGGMGDVLLVRDEDIDRKVAMKRLKHDDPQAVMRFIEEIHTIGSLEHPNIIPIHDVGIDSDGAYFFIMKHVHGETLESIIDKLAAGDPDYHARYTYDVRVQLFMDILHAVDFAHSRDIIHRDIKPANIMVGPHGEVIVMDWGLAKSIAADKPAPPDPERPNPLDLAERLPRDFFKDLQALPPKQQLRLTQHGELLGTPAYMSPEQAQGQVDQVDKRTDTYALAVLLHELMTLGHYLEGKTSLITMLHGVIHDAPGPMQMREQSARVALQQTLPAELGHFIAHGLKKDPTQRYEDAAAMLQALQRVIDGTFAVECPVTLLKRANRELGRAVDERPMLVMSAVMGGALLFVGLLVTSIVSLVT